MNSIIKELIRRREAGTLDASMGRGLLPKCYPCVSSKLVAAAEVQLGFPLPALLREIYLKVGNGGFGPGCGLVGLEGGSLLHWDHGDLAQTYLADRGMRTR